MVAAAWARDLALGVVGAYLELLTDFSGQYGRNCNTIGDGNIQVPTKGTAAGWRGKGTKGVGATFEVTSSGRPSAGKGQMGPRHVPETDRRTGYGRRGVDCRSVVQFHKRNFQVQCPGIESAPPRPLENW
jgi:hypothetical protein